MARFTTVGKKTILQSVLQNPPPPPSPANPPRDHRKVDRIELDKTEYQLLRDIAGLAASFLPEIERTSAVTRNTEYVRLVKRLKEYALIKSDTDNSEETTVALIQLARELM